MVLHNAADSLADLLQIKHERELQSSLVLQKQPSDKLMGGLSAARDSVADLSSVARDRRMKSLREPRPNGQRIGGEYDPPEIEEQDDDDAPIWDSTTTTTTTFFYCRLRTSLCRTRSIRRCHEDQGE
eukprot:scaffold11866_cov23-Cyclotella_meneghiniana.AAC.3